MNLYRPAADLFESMLNGEAELTPTARDQVLDWWATAIDRYVRILPAAERAAAYDHLIAHMEGELRRDSGSGAAAYWLAAAAFARGQVNAPGTRRFPAGFGRCSPPTAARRCGLISIGW